jgi:hypothetical protein
MLKRQLHTRWTGNEVDANYLAVRVIFLEDNMTICQSLFSYTLIYGIGLSLLLTTITTVSGVIVPDMWVSKYPPDIQQKYGPMSPRAARLRPFVAVLVLVTSLVVPLLGLFALRAKVGEVPFILAFTFASVTLLVFNLFDLLILDWLLFCTVQPKLMVLPGTEGMAGYRDYRFHFLGFLKGLIFCAVGGLFIALVWVVEQKLFF